MGVPRLPHSPVDGRVGCYEVLATVISATVHMQMHVSFWILVVSRYTSKSVIAGSFCCSIAKLCLSLWPHGLQRASLLCPPSPGVCSSSCREGRWCHPTISSSAALFFCLQSFPASESFPMSQRLWQHSQGSRSGCFSIIPLLSLWSNKCWQFDLWFLCLF